jgi:hypothetical protein
LEKLAAVQAAAKNEMAFEQRAGIAENLQHFFVGHGGEDSPKADADKLGRFGR